MSAPTGRAELVVPDLAALDPRFHERYLTYLDEELARLPPAVRAELPEINVVAVAAVDGVEFRARYFSDEQLIVLTPQYDFRGNALRCVAAWMIDTGEAAKLVAAWAGMLAERTSVPLYRGSHHSQTDQLAAYVAAVLSGRRQVLDLLMVESGGPEFLDAVLDFLETWGVDTSGSALPFGYLSEIESVDSEYRIRPGDVLVTTTAPMIDRFEYKELPPTSAAEVAASTLLDVWSLPEFVLGDSVTSIHVVDDVRRSDCDIAGFASSHVGGRSTIVTELRNRQRIFAHELGHALHSRFRDGFPQQQWLALVPEIDGYFGDAYAFIKSGVRQPDFSPSLLERGFVTSYGSSSLNEDVAEYVEALLIGDERLWAAEPTSARVRAKVALMIRFFAEQVDPAFSRFYFEQIALRRSREEARWGI